MVIINGSMYQKAHNPAGKLCDRIILSGEQGGFVCAVELKGGRSQPSIPPIVEQIQAGIVLADELLNGISPRGCYPILAFSGRMIPIASTAFKSKNNRVCLPWKLSQEEVEIARPRCGTELVALLAN